MKDVLKLRPEFVTLLKNQTWRLNHLYWFKDVSGKLRRFRMNDEQQELYARLHTRNAVLKARQLGVSTFVALLILDYSLFRDHHKAGIIDIKKEGYEGKLNKIRMAWQRLDYLPENPTESDRLLSSLGRYLKSQTGKRKGDGDYGFVLDQSKRVVFANGSEVSGDTTYRGDTLQFLHVSELAAISQRFPIRAEEVVTGAFPAVPQDGIIVVESTHEGGRRGRNFELMNKAMENSGKGRLNALDFRFFFFPWQQAKKYSLELEGYQFKEETLKYFEELRKDHGITVTESQMAWWESSAATFGWKMKQEYPAVPEEAFASIGDNAIWGRTLVRLRDQGRIGSRFVVDPTLPVYCSWDLGRADHTALTFIQPVAGENRVVWGYQNNRQALDHFVQVIRRFEEEHGVDVCRNFLPHDAAHHDYEMMTVEKRLIKAGLKGVKVVPRCQSLWASIGEVRMFLPTCVFHERCGDDLENGLPGLLDCLESYHTDERTGEVKHDDSSHFADSLRMYVEASLAGYVPGANTGVVGSGASGKRKGNGGDQRAIMC